jgi:tripartite-type tricarboxylate transporter receptor subunit TctC
MVTRRVLLTSTAVGIVSMAGLRPPAVARPLARTVHILTGFTPGLLDAMARLIAGQMKEYAETIVVETRPGAGGRISVEALKTAAADGSALLIAPLGFMMFYPHVYRTLRYEPRDFTAVSTVASTPTLLTVGRKVPADVTTLADFVAWCRANPHHATYGTPGVGTTLHLLGLMLARTAGFQFLHVPYQGRGAIDDVLKGEIAAAFLPIAASLGLVQSGELRALVTTGPRRSSLIPETPTVRETGYSMLEDLTWYGFFVPAKTPAEVVERLNGAIQHALSTDEVKSGMTKLGVEIDSISMNDFARLISSESERWKAIVQAVGFVPTD